MRKKKASRCPRDFLRQCLGENNPVSVFYRFSSRWWEDLFSYIFIFHAFSLRSNGVREENIRELSFYLKRNTNQRETQTFILEVVHFIR